MSAADLTLALGQPASHVAQGPGRGLPAHLTGAAVLGRARWVPRDAHTPWRQGGLAFRWRAPAWAHLQRKSSTLVSKPSPTQSPRLP